MMSLRYVTYAYDDIEPADTWQEELARIEQDKQLYKAVIQEKIEQEKQHYQEIIRSQFAQMEIAKCSAPKIDYRTVTIIEEPEGDSDEEFDAAISKALKKNDRRTSSLSLRQPSTDNQEKT